MKKCNLPSSLPLLCRTPYIGPSTSLALQFLQYLGDATYTLERNMLITICQQLLYIVP